MEDECMSYWDAAGNLLRHFSAPHCLNGCFQVLLFSIRKTKNKEVFFTLKIEGVRLGVCWVGKMGKQRGFVCGIFLQKVSALWAWYESGVMLPMGA